MNVGAKSEIFFRMPVGKKPRAPDFFYALLGGMATAKGGDRLKGMKVKLEKGKKLWGGGGGGGRNCFVCLG